VNGFAAAAIVPATAVTDGAHPITINCASKIFHLFKDACTHASRSSADFFSSIILAA
jgi:hypothetical protein